MKKPTISAYEFMRLFPDEAAAIQYLESRRWRGGVVCPHCKHKHTHRLTRAPYHKCGGCKKQFTVRTGTVFERSHIPLDKWLYAMYLFATARKGVSSLQLSKELGVTQKSAWHLTHRIREACRTAGFRLSGAVEVDETYIGGKESNKHERKKLRAGRGAVGKQAVIGLRERGGRVRAKPIRVADAATVRGEIDASVETGATLYTDEAAAYRGMGGLFYKHERVNHSAKEFVNGMAHTNGIESVWAVLKRGYNGVYHNWSAKHCGRYVDEFTFRLNEGRCDNHTLTRIAAMCDGAVGKRLTYRELIR